MYDYDFRRPRIAAKLNLFGEWRAVVTKHEEAERQELQALLRKLVPYLGSVGYDLDLQKSYLSKDYHGSDGLRIEGFLYVTERPENNTKATKPEQVATWIEAATGMHGGARHLQGDSWVVDISDS